MKLGNLFTSRDPELINIVSNDVMDGAAVDSVKSLERLGLEGKSAFMEMLKKNPRAFNESIKLNPLRVFSQVQSRRKQPALVKEMKDQAQLFSKLYIATQVRDAYMGEFFKNETLSYPPSLSKHGLIRSGDKAELLPFLKNSIGEADDLSGVPVVEAVVLEMSVVVNQLKPDHGSSFSSYAVDKVFSYVKRYQQKASALRIDVCYDTYIEKSLKGVTRENRVLVFVGR